MCGFVCVCASAQLGYGELLEWGLQINLLEGLEMGLSLSSPSPSRSSTISKGSEAYSAVSSPHLESSMLATSVHPVREAAGGSDKGGNRV